MIADKTSLVRVGPAGFACAVAENEIEQSWGLRNQLHPLRDSEGMYFPLDTEFAEMHMSGMSIPIDMIFIGPDYRVKMLAENVSPLFSDVVRCRKVKAVLEVAAGVCQRLGIIAAH